MATRTTTKTTGKPAAKKATAKPSTKPTETGQNRAAVLEELRKQGWDGPVSYTMTDLKGVLLPWVAAGCPADAAGVPAGAMKHRHPSAKAAANPARGIARDLRAAIKDALDGGDADRVVGLAQSLRDALADA